MASLTSASALQLGIKQCFENVFHYHAPSSTDMNAMNSYRNRFVPLSTRVVKALLIYHFVALTIAKAGRELGNTR